MLLRNQLLENPYLEFHNNIFYQKDLPRNNQFEQVYLKVRESENRIYSDHIIKKLPEFDTRHPNGKEWQMRKSTLYELVKYLRESGARSILELGCGNGWLAHNLAVTLKIEICALDINEMELLQGAQVFGEQKNLCFVYADIFSNMLSTQKFDIIVLGSSIQYFRDLKILISKLARLLDSAGKIYIIDSPFYSSTVELNAAKKRSQDHFNSLGFPEMAQQYFHHTFDELNNFKYKILYNPRSFVSRFKRKLLNIPLSIFPIICISRNNTTLERE
jgi:ubiquinone/menaquinone biosynthesis C-methylase UbiE